MPPDVRSCETARARRAYSSSQLARVDMVVIYGGVWFDWDIVPFYDVLGDGAQRCYENVFHAKGKQDARLSVGSVAVRRNSQRFSLLKRRSVLNVAVV